ncbi:LysR family transcriptional regulator [Paraburkholderia xenovorans]|uniref:LysR substrate-binding domain-containing protein n=1 Tax=Paraburkholderia xenovorans TaxID=36873 RepID=UPI0038B92723
MNLRHLEHFLALVKTGSFRKASETLHLTQPALSRSVQTLEEELGIRLIDRVGKRNEVTQFGVLVAEKASKIVADAIDLKHSVQLMTQRDSGTIRLGLGSAPAATFTAPLMSYVLTQYPRVHLHLSTNSPETQVALLRERALDALLVHSRTIAPQPDLHIELLGTARSGFMSRHDHPLAKRKRLTFQDLVEYPIVSTKVTDEISAILVHRFGPIAHPSRFVRASSESVPALLEVVLSTDAIFFGLLSTVRPGYSGQIVALDFKLPREAAARYAFITLDGRTNAPMLGPIQKFCADLVSNAAR